MPQGPLLTPQELDSLMAKGEPLSIIDTRSPADYASGHIPGAVNINQFFTYLAMSTPDGLRSLQETFARLLGEAGVGGDTRIVIYEDTMHNGYGQSCRAWFLLRYLGHERTNVLHGGFRSWKAESRPVTTVVPAISPKVFPVHIEDGWMVTWEQMLDALRDPSIVKLDVRDYDEWIGESSSPYSRDYAPRKGRLPGSVWIEWYRMMRDDSEIPRFRSKEDVLDICREVNISPSSKVYVYCFKGARAANTMVAMREAGFEDVHLYFGSWNEWSRDPNLPIETGSPEPSRMASKK